MPQQLSNLESGDFDPDVEHFIVSTQGPHWQVSHRGSVDGPFNDRQAALGAAVAAAEEVVAAGRKAAVYVEEPERKFQPAWSRDPAMPPGDEAGPALSQDVGAEEPLPDGPRS